MQQHGENTTWELLKRQIFVKTASQLLLTTIHKKPAAAGFFIYRMADLLLPLCSHI
jgi:hypothetical protein